MAARLGPSGNNVIDLAVGDDALYTLDVVESAVRAFGSTHATSSRYRTLLVRSGAPIAVRRVAGASYRHPVPGLGLAIVDQARAVVEVVATTAVAGHASEQRHVG
jgi:hypothetical protein